MAYEICQISSYTGTGTITSASNAYDNGASGGPVTGTGYSGTYAIANDTSYATHQSLATTTVYTATTSSISAKQWSGSWSSSTLYVKYRLVTAGDGGSTQWDSYSEIQYNIGAGWVSINSSGGDNDTGVLTFSLSLGASPTLSSIQVRTIVSGHAKTGTLPDFIASAIGLAYLYDVYVEASYVSDTITSFYSNGRIVTGNPPYLTIVFTGSAPTVTPGTWTGAWVSGVSKYSTDLLAYYQLFTATQGSNTATVWQEVAMPASGPVSMSLVHLVTGNRGSYQQNDYWNRALTSVPNWNTQISFSNYYNGYISQATYTYLNGI